MVYRKMQEGTLQIVPSGVFDSVPQLAELDFSQNFLTTTPPLNSTALTSLYVAKVKRSSHRSRTLQNNYITIADARRLPSTLKILDFSSNALTEIIGAFGPQLEIMSVTTNFHG